MRSTEEHLDSIPPTWLDCTAVPILLGDSSAKRFVQARDPAARVADAFGECGLHWLRMGGILQEMGMFSLRQLPV